MTAIAAITGAASGIGLATARRLLGEGWTVIALDISENQLAAARETLSNYADRLVTPRSAYRAGFPAIFPSSITAIFCAR